MDQRLLLFSKVILMLCAASFIHGFNFRRDYTKIKDNGWLKFHSTLKKWEEAVLTCYYEGAVLASPLNEQIRKALTIMMMEHGQTKAPIFTGIHNKYSVHVYQSIEGVSLADIPLTWSNEPSGQTTENCILMNIDGSVTESLCKEKLSFGCHKSEPVDTVSKCGASDKDDQKFRHDYSEVKGQGWLKFHRIPQNWSEADQTCYYEGAVLASPMNKEIRNALGIMMVEQGLTKAPMFTGIRNNYPVHVDQSLEQISWHNTGASTTDTMSPLSSIKLLNEPSSQPSENCTAMNFDGSITETLCQENHPFACYKNVSNKNINKCGTEDTEYLYYRHTRSCYKFHHDRKTWSNAFRICNAEGGYLAVINSEEEAQIIYRLARRNSNLYESITIGFHDWNEHRTWQTIHGQSLRDAGYSKWAKEEPNNSTKYGPGEYCGGVITKLWQVKEDGVLNDVSCQHAYNFICEMNSVATVSKPISVTKSQSDSSTNEEYNDDQMSYTSITISLS